MRRDWIGELREVLRVKDIAERTGISQQRLREFYTGKRPFHSKLPEYEKIRNLNRQVAYEKLRKMGASAEIAKRHRRTLFDPYREEPVRKTIRFLRPEVVPEERQQLRILGIFRHRKTGQVKIQEGFSKVYKEIKEKQQEREAIRYAQAELGSTHWEIAIVLEKEHVTFRGGE